MFNTCFNVYTHTYKWLKKQNILKLNDENFFNFGKDDKKKK